MQNDFEIGEIYRINYNNVQNDKPMDLRNMDKRCHANIPYPDIYIKKENPRYIKILLELYAGRKGELTAADQYVYQYIAAKDEFYDLKQIAFDISIVEMKHFGMLGRVIKQLGGDPRYWTYKDNKYKMWDASNVRCSKTAKKMLLDDIEDETYCIKAYEAAIKTMDDDEIEYILRRIQMDEEIHLKRLMELYKKYK